MEIVQNESKTKKIDKKWLKTNEIFVPEIVPKIRNKNWSHLKTTNNIFDFKNIQESENKY